MKMSLAAGIAALAIAGLAVTGCGGDDAPAPAGTPAPAATTAPTAVVTPNVVVPASGATRSLTVKVGDTFTIALDISRRQARAALPVSGWARDYDDATALTTEGPVETVPRAHGALQTRLQFTATAPGSADMGFRQTTEVKSGTTPLARSAIVHLTVN